MKVTITKIVPDGRTAARNGGYVDCYNVYVTVENSIIEGAHALMRISGSSKTRILEMVREELYKKQSKRQDELNELRRINEILALSEESNVYQW